MTNQQKYLATPNRGRNDVNKFGWQIGDILHLSGNQTANGYNYCGYKEIELPCETPVRIIGIHQTNLNAGCKNGIGDVYIDFECIYLKNHDNTPVTCGNRHAWCLLEANPDFMVCPDGSGDLGFVRNGVWYSYAGTDGQTNRFGQTEYIRNKVIDLCEVA